VEGAGELITPVTSREKAWVVLVRPRVEIPTKLVYELYDEWEKERVDSENDLEGPCAEAWPVVADTLEKMKTICGEDQEGRVKVQLSGSGPAVFAWFEDEDKAAAERVYDRGKEVFSGIPVYLAKAL